MQLLNPIVFKNKQQRLKDTLGSLLWSSNFHKATWLWQYLLPTDFRITMATYLCICLQRQFKKGLPEKKRPILNGRWHHPIALDPRLNEKEKMRWVPALLFLCFLTGNIIWPATSCSLPWWTVSPLKVSQSKASFLKWLPVTATRKKSCLITCLESLLL